MSQTMGVICQVLALACPPAPDAAAIQAAYDGEESRGSTRHDKNLRVLAAKCHDGQDDRYLCEVSFTARDDPGQPLYFDVVAIRRTNGGWILESGLCRR